MPVFRSVNRKELTLMQEMIDKKINAPMTSSAGRLFDSVSAMLGLCTVSGFDSEAPVRLESAIVLPTDNYYPYEVGNTVNFARTLMAVLNDIPKADISAISAKFHNSVARAILEVSVKMRKKTGLNKVVLSGGVFQNKYLLEQLTRLLNENRFEVFTNQAVPANDGGVSLGQLIIAAKRRRLCV
jgi:hydrogenase maturation protein HypF